MLTWLLPLVSSVLLRLPAAQVFSQEPAVLRGHWSHAPAGDTVQLIYRREHLSRTATAVLDRTGNFALAVPDLAEPVMAELYIAEQHTTLYLTPGDKLTQNLDFPRFAETLRYTGRGADLNNYLARALYSFEQGPAGTLPRPQDQLTAATTPGQMRQAADSFRQARQNFLTTYTAAHPLPAAFQQEMRAHIDLQWALTLLEYPERYQRLAHQAAVLPAAYYDFLPQLPPHTLDTYNVRERGVNDNTLVFMCLRAYGQRLIPSGTLSTNPAEGEQLYAWATAELRPVEARDIAVSMLLFQQLKDNLPGVEAAYPAFRAHNQDSSKARDLRYAMAQQRLVSSGRVAPAFTLLDDTGKAVSLADFKGKVVYLDFWGTWCAPCLAEVPASISLREQFASRGVVFVYISVADEELKWKKVLAAKHLKGPGSVHLRSLDNTVPLVYNVMGYPSYVLIGRDGRIRLANAPRPSAKAEIVAALEQSLKE